MGKRIDRICLELVLFAVGFFYFQATLRVRPAAILFALALCALIHVMIAQLPRRKQPEPKAPKRNRLRLVSRKRAPRSALYGALYMALYLFTGMLVYLPLSLALLFLSALGFKKSPEEAAEGSAS